MGQRILVAGIVALEVTYRLESFPLYYEPVRYPFFALDSGVSGVGYNVARALGMLGNEALLATMLGGDVAGSVVRQSLARQGLDPHYIQEALRQTPHSLILYDRQGQRQIHVDLKDIQERSYPEERFQQGLSGCALAVVCNANFARPLLHLARRAGVPVATDVHAISDIDDAYNQEFMRAADILFMSHEKLPMPPWEWIRLVRERFDNEIIVVGMGEEGALLSVRGERGAVHVPAVRGLPVVSTVGAGDALFSCFVHAYLGSHEPHQSLRKAAGFAASKLGSAGGAEGFLTAEELARRFGQG